MDTKFKEIVLKIISMNKLIIENINEDNIEKILYLLNKLENNLKRELSHTEQSKKRIKPNEELLKKLGKMNEDEIYKEFMDETKYPTVESIKEAVKGFVPSSVLRKVKRRETLVKHIIKICKKYEQFKL